MTSFFLEEKLDMLIDRLFTDPFRRVLTFCQRLACPRAAALAAEADAEHARELAAGALEVDEQTQRINLARSLPTTCTLLTRFFRRLTLQEPTLQEVVVMYTEIGGASRDDGYDGGSAAPGSLRVRLKSFRDIPTADVEVVLPGLRASGMKSAEIVKIVLMLVGGIATAFYGFAFGQSSRWLLTATLLGLLGLRAYQTWASVSHAKHTMNEFIRTTLYHRSQDSQRGVMLSVRHRARHVWAPAHMGASARTSSSSHMRACLCRASCMPTVNRSPCAHARSYSHAGTQLDCPARAA